MFNDFLSIKEHFYYTCFQFVYENQSFAFNIKNQHKNRISSFRWYEAINTSRTAFNSLDQTMCEGVASQVCIASSILHIIANATRHLVVSSWYTQKNTNISYVSLCGFCLPLTTNKSTAIITIGVNRTP